MLNLVERIRRFNTVDLVASYLAKFSLGLGLGLLWGAQTKGWLFILLAIGVGLRAEIKFWRNR